MLLNYSWAVCWNAGAGAVRIENLLESGPALFSPPELSSRSNKNKNQKKSGRSKIRTNEWSADMLTAANNTQTLKHTPKSATVVVTKVVNEKRYESESKTSSIP